MNKKKLLLPSLLLFAFLTLIGGVLHVMGQDVYWPGFAAMIFFYALIFLVGSYAAQSRDTSNDMNEMMLAGRSLPVFVAIFTMSATWIGGGYINGTAEYTASWGLVWVQAPWGYALSLIIGGLFYASKMRRYEFQTMLDPLQIRYGRNMGALLYLPALMGEIFWTAAILTALGTTFGTVLGLDFTYAIILSAFVAIAYTALGGLWAVAFTDVLQLILLFIGLFLIVPFALDHVGGFENAWEMYQAKKGGLAQFFPPWRGWKNTDWGDLYWNWWDYAFLLIFGGIPWHVYFQRVLSAKDEKTAMKLSVFAGFVCLVAAVPAVLIGIVGDVVSWESLGIAKPSEAALTLPYVMRYLAPPLITTIGLGAIAAAVMSSVDSSILSASSMAAWNVYRPLFRPNVDSKTLTSFIKKTIWIIGIAATLLALKIKSVYVLWFLCSDFVYTILFPQLTTALFDKKANVYGSLAGFIISFILRFGGGEPELGIPTLLPYPMISESGAVYFPFRTLAMVSGLITIMIVSRLTQKQAPAVKLKKPQL